MRNIRKVVSLIVASCIFSIFLNADEARKVIGIQKYDVQMPQELIAASGGFYPAVGSGIDFVKKLENGNLEFKVITDRGPNFPISDHEKVLASFYPGFSPKIASLLVTPGKGAIITGFNDIKYQGKPVSGFSAGQSSEVIVDQNQKKLPLGFGLDTESVAVLDESRLVVGDEYYPSINIVDAATGNILEMLTPGKGLPEIFKFRRRNRGFESVACYNKKKIYGVLEGALDIDNKTSKTAKLIRIVEIDLKTRKTKMYAYQFDYDAYEHSGKVKIGDIAVVKDGELLLVEQGPTPDKQYRNVIYKVNLNNATDITNIKLTDGRELEFGTLDELKAVKFASKALIFNPKEHGWTHKKLEGLTMIDEKTIAITNDNDFGIVGYDGKSCFNDKKEDKCEKLAPKIGEQNKQTSLWIVQFSRSIV